MLQQKSNKTDVLLETLDDISEKFMWTDFPYRNAFQKLCVIKPHKISADRRKFVIAGNPNPRDLNRPCVYALVIGGRIFKIGQTITGMTKRVGSYNCGQVAYRENGTCSVTNYWVLQSLCNIGMDIDVYCLFPEEVNYEYFGVKGREAFPSPKVIEGILIEKVVRHYGGEKPIGCIQS